jgi:predicted transcriptional regulator of viral defense system
MAVEWNFCPEIASKTTSRPDLAIAERASGQHGVVSRAQLLELGLGYRAVDERIARGLLHPIHRGVYAFGHRVRTSEATWTAAISAAGPDAVISHRSAAAVWGIRRSDALMIDVIVPRKLRRPGIRAHRIVLPRDEFTDELEIPVTTPARTLFDLAAVLPFDQLEFAFNEAEYRRLTSPTSLDALLARYQRRRWTTNLRRVLEKHHAIGVTPIRSVLEERFATFLDVNGLPRPLINRTSDHGELDARWPEQRLVVEVDGWAAHGTRDAFERDRARDRALVTAGWRVVRITWRQLETDADTIARQLSALLGATPPPQSARRARRPPPATRATRSAAP